VSVLDLPPLAYACASVGVAFAVGALPTWALWALFAVLQTGGLTLGGYCAYRLGRAHGPVRFIDRALTVRWPSRPPWARHRRRE